MLEGQPLTILCVSSYEKGQEFIRTCKAAGCRVAGMQAVDLIILKKAGN